jgi:sugar phosphate isomerase/epimerase
MDKTIIGIGSSVPGIGGSVAGLVRGLTTLKQAGCSHAELYAPALGVTIAGRDNTHRVAEVAEAVAASGLTPTLHAPIAVNLMDTIHLDLHKAVLASSIRFAAAMGAGIVVIHPGRVHPQADLAARDQLLTIEREAVLTLADLAGRHGIRIAMENLNPNRNMMAGTMTSYALDPVVLGAQITAINHPAVCGTLDFGHGWLAAGKLGFDYLAALRHFAPVVGHLHVTDNCGMPITMVDATDDEHVGYGMGDLHLPIGWGSVPYADALADLPIRPGTVATLEIKASHGAALADSVAMATGFAARLNKESV